MIEVIVKEGIVKKYHYQNKYKTIIQLGLVMILLRRIMETTSPMCQATEGSGRLSLGYTAQMSSGESGM